MQDAPARLPGLLRHPGPYARRRRTSGWTAAAMVWAARSLLLKGVANMLRVSTYEAVMKTVSGALAADVLES